MLFRKYRRGVVKSKSNKIMLNLIKGNITEEEYKNKIISLSEKDIRYSPKER
jgi:hypothetical protein